MAKNATEVLDEVASNEEQVRDSLREVADWFHDHEGELLTRDEAVEQLTEDLSMDESIARDVVRNLVSDLVDPVVQVPASGEKYVGVIDFVEFDGAYGYVDYHDTIGERRRVTCAQCVHNAEYDTEVVHASAGSGSFDESADYDELLEAVHEHYEQAHESVPEEVETGATLNTGTTIGGNTAWHAGNDGSGSGLNADTLQGNSPSDLIDNNYFPVIDEASTFTESDVTVTHSNTRVLSGSIELGDTDSVSYPSANNPFTDSGRFGVVINPNTTLSEVTGTLYSGVTATTMYVSDGGSILGSASFSGGTATISGLSLSSGNNYYILADAGGSTYDVDGNDSPGFPITSEFFDTTDGADGTQTSSILYNFASMEAASAPTSGTTTISWPSPSDVKAWDLATYQATEDGETVTVDVVDTPVPELDHTVDISSEEGNTQGVAWNNDGSKLYIIGDGSNTVYEYDASTAYDVSTASLSTSFDASSDDGSMNGIAWNNDGSKLYLCGSDNAQVYEYDLTTSFDVSTASLTSTFDTSGQEFNPYGVAWNGDGSKMYITGSSDAIQEYDASTAYDVTSLTHVNSLDVSSEDSGPEDLSWSDDGSILHVVGSGNNKAYSYTLSTPYDTTTATFDQSLSLSVSTASGITWDDVGDHLYVTDSLNSDVLEYDAKNFNFDSGYQTIHFTDISQNFDISTIGSTVNPIIRANLSRSDTSNDPTLDYAARKGKR